MQTAAAHNRARLQDTALRLFQEHGYAQTSVAQIAAAAGVSHMTFFRHFPTKESVVVGDLFDPVIATAVAAQPTDLPPLGRATRGLLTALAGDAASAELASDGFRRRIELIATTGALRSAAWASGQATQDAICQELTAQGTDPADARAAAGAVIGAATALLLAWASEPARESAAQALRRGLSGLAGGAG